MSNIDQRMGLDAEFGGGAASEAPEGALGPYLRAVSRHLRLVLLITVLALSAAVLTITRMGSTYEASASILVSPLSGTDASFLGIGALRDTGDPTRNVQTAAALVDSPAAAVIAARGMGAGWNTGRVQKAITVAPRGQSNVLAITAQAGTPQDARLLANRYATAAVSSHGAAVQRQVAQELVGLNGRLKLLEHFSPTSSQTQDLATRVTQLQALSNLGGDPSLSLTQFAQDPGSATGASHVLILALALMAGLTVGGLAALATEFFNRRVRDADELTALYPIPMLASIPKVTGGRHGHGLSPLMLPPAAFEQVRTLRVQLQNRPSAPVIMLTSAGAGDGKTSTAAALAVAFAEGDHTVILLDMDLRKPDVTNVFQVDASSGRAPASDRKSSLAAMLAPAAGFSGLRVLPAPRGDEVELELLLQRLPELIKEATQLADYVIVDTAPIGEISDALRILSEVDQVVFVARPRHTDRAKVLIARNLLARAGTTPVGMVLVGQTIAGASRSPYGYASAAAVSTGVRETERPSARPLARSARP